MNERVGNLGIAPRLLEMSLQLMKGQECQGCAAEIPCEVSPCEGKGL